MTVKMSNLQNLQKDTIIHPKKYVHTDTLIVK